MAARPPTENGPLACEQKSLQSLPVRLIVIVVSRVLERQRALVVRTETERSHREASLRDAKESLEHEVEDHRRTEERLRFALRELDHRGKNTLAMVQSIAQSTLETSPSQDKFREAFYGRIEALARVHTALAAHRWSGLPLRELIEDGLTYESGGSVDLQFLPSGVRCQINIPLPTRRPQAFIGSTSDERPIDAVRTKKEY